MKVKTKMYLKYVGWSKLIISKLYVSQNVFAMLIKVTASQKKLFLDAKACTSLCQKFVFLTLSL